MTLFDCPECDHSGGFQFDPLEPYPQDRVCPECGARVGVSA